MKASILTAIGCIAGLAGLFYWLEWKPERDLWARCQRWTFAPVYCRGQACHEYKQQGTSLICVHWECQQRVCIDQPHPDGGSKP